MAALVENNDRVLKIEELARLLVKGSKVPDNGVAQHISRLRGVLGDNIYKPVYIQTVYKVGYHFIGDLSSTTQKANAT